MTDYVWFLIRMYKQEQLKSNFLNNTHNKLTSNILDMRVNTEFVEYEKKEKKTPKALNEIKINKFA